MLSVIWTVFSLVAGALAKKHSGDPNDILEKKNTLEPLQTWDKSLESGIEEVDASKDILPDPQQELDAVERLRQEGVRMRVALTRISAALKEHGLVEHDIWENDMPVNSAH
ncbi:hypothetical protein C8R45DRAFT_1098964 [Mycena sanguinolenta]|nr:hypothetical protein C8R45DRAFT_1098964 [Mycena sanguinolenta]